MPKKPARLILTSHAESDPPGIRVAVAARPALYRELLCQALRGIERFVVVGAAWDEQGAVDLLFRGRPRVLIFDYEALGPSGESIVSRLRRDFPATRILVVATRSGDDTAQRVLHSGASGLLSKESDFATLVRAIRAIASGELWANRVVTAQTLERLTSLSSSRNGPSDGRLTRREVDIVAEVCRGSRNKEIGRKLGISEQTVKSHLNNVLRKLHLPNRIALLIHQMGRLQLKA